MPSDDLEHQDRQSVGSVVKASAVLNSFDRTRTWQSIAEISAVTGIHRTTVYRLARTLQDLGWLTSRSDGRFGIGLELLRLGSLSAEQITLNHSARPVLEKLSVESKEGTYLFVRNKARTICIDRFMGSEPVQLSTIRVGQSLPLTFGSASMVFLAFDDDPVVKEALGSPRVDLARVEQTRSTGYALNREEAAPGIFALSAPVYGSGQNPVAAISVAGLAPRFVEEKVEAVREALLAACAELSETLLLNR